MEIYLTQEQTKDLREALEAGGEVRLKGGPILLLKWKIVESERKSTLPNKPNGKLRSSLTGDKNFVKKVKDKYLSTGLI